LARGDSGAECAEDHFQLATLSRVEVVDEVTLDPGGVDGEGALAVDNRLVRGSRGMILAHQ
jgi:hypothetical protein